jgi:hypothetical protein
LCWGVAVELVPSERMAEQADKKRRTYRELWRFVSAFGVMFAVLSWAVESSWLPLQGGATKGFVALATGIGLYLILARHAE